MLYRPNYCSNCGEKIERVDWGIFTSRRFCGVCETEYKGHDILTRAIVAFGFVMAIFGLGAFLLSAPKKEPAFARQTTKLVEMSAKPEVDSRSRPNNNLVVPAKTPDVMSNTPVHPLAGSKPATAKSEVSESQYFCGAETKKGTPCSRRVKGNTRCYQHTGMPAMAGSERLKVN